MKSIKNLWFALNDGLRCIWYGTIGKFACTSVLGDIGSSPVVKTNNVSVMELADKRMNNPGVNPHYTS